jgi:hypothetical protein
MCMCANQVTAEWDLYVNFVQLCPLFGRSHTPYVQCPLTYTRDVDINKLTTSEALQTMCQSCDTSIGFVCVKGNITAILTA